MLFITCGAFLTWYEKGPAVPPVAPPVDPNIVSECFPVSIVPYGLPDKIGLPVKSFIEKVSFADAVVATVIPELRPAELGTSFKTYPPVEAYIVVGSICVRYEDERSKFEDLILNTPPLPTVVFEAN